jgi:hypothetical protein
MLRYWGAAGGIPEAAKTLQRASKRVARQRETIVGGVGGRGRLRMSIRLRRDQGRTWDTLDQEFMMTHMDDGLTSPRTTTRPRR